MWDTARNSHHVVFIVEKKVHGRWEVWIYQTPVGDHGRTKQKKLFNLKVRETYWFRVVAREGRRSTPSDPIRVQTKARGNHRVYYTILLST